MTLSSQDAVAALTSATTALDVSAGTLGPYAATASAAKAAVLGGLALMTKALAVYAPQLPAIAGDAISRSKPLGAARASAKAEAYEIAPDQIDAASVWEAGQISNTLFDAGVRAVFARTYDSQALTSANAIASTMAAASAAIVAGGGTAPQIGAVKAVQASLAATVLGMLSPAAGDGSWFVTWIGGLAGGDWNRYRYATGT